MVNGAVADGSLRILVWAQLSCARDLTHAADEISMIERLGVGDNCVVRTERDQPWTELAATIRAFQPTIFHFIGHGNRGELVAIDTTPDGMHQEQRIGPQRLVDTFSGASTPLRGVFLNGCDTAHWAPHFVPNGGWVIGSNQKVSDDLSAFFAPTFYEHLLDGSTDSEAFDLTLEDVAIADEPPRSLVRWVEDPDPSDFLHKVFSRQAFHAPVLYEGSLIDLGDALNGVRQAISNSALATRVELPGSSTVYCREPLGAEVVAALKPRLARADFDYRQLRTEFPQVVQFADGWMDVRPTDRHRLMVLADQLDGSRNQLLIAVNGYLPAAKHLPLIDISSTFRSRG